MTSVTLINEATQLDVPRLTRDVLGSLDTRSRDIVERRYGLASGQAETLESIGQTYGITRERVRQIETQAKKTVAQAKEPLASIHLLLENIFATHGGVLAESHVVSLTQAQLQQPELRPTYVTFYLEILPPYTYISRDTHFAPHWRHPEVVSAHATTVVEQARAILEQIGHPISHEYLLAELAQALKAMAGKLTPQHAYAQLEASKHINKTPFGEWGLAHWAETTPRGVADKGYAVLRRHGKPEHFTVITELINQARFDHKHANAQTVHNELIKDKRFVLVGRGLYGLAEWGYIPGTVADVVAELLTRAPGPLTTEEVVAKVLEQRQVKRNTILLGLQNQSRFVKTLDNRYTLKENS